MSRNGPAPCPDLRDRGPRGSPRAAGRGAGARRAELGAAAATGRERGRRVRVAMLLAVLERRAGLKLSDADVYVSTVGGMKLTEPGADLRSRWPCASAAVDRPYPHTLAASARSASRARSARRPGRSSARARHPGWASRRCSARGGAPAEALRVAFSLTQSSANASSTARSDGRAVA